MVVYDAILLLILSRSGCKMLFAAAFDGAANDQR
jgi:hypothetical protein